MSHSVSVVVCKENTALWIGSGDMEVFATPAMAALMENAAMTAVATSLEEGQTTVGSELNTTHVKPSGIGAMVTATAVLKAVDGRKLTFDVIAHDEQGLVGEGTHVRFVVDRDRFMQKLAPKKEN